MLTELPPNADASLPSPQAQRPSLIWRGFWLTALLLLLFLLVAPMTIRSRKTFDQTEAVSNARQIGIALFEFEKEFESFPDASTIAAVQSKSGTDLDLGTKYSNDFFRQLISSGIAQSEAFFYTKIKGTRRPDGVITKGDAIKKGECGFTYLLGAKITDNPSRPLLVTPMIPGTDRFDRKRFDGKAVVLRMDSSVTSLPIDKDGHIMVDGRNLMDPDHPIWDGHAPVIAWPDL